MVFRPGVSHVPLAESAKSPGLLRDRGVYFISMDGDTPPTRTLGNWRAFFSKDSKVVALREQNLRPEPFISGMSGSRVELDVSGSALAKPGVNQFSGLRCSDA